MSKLFLSCILIIILNGCNSDIKKEMVTLTQINDTLTKEKLVLIQENDSLKKEIDELKNGAPRLFAIARKQNDDKNYIESIKTLNSLIEKYPSAIEINESKELVLQSEKEIKKIKDAENTKIRLEQERIDKALNKLSKRRDDVEKTTKYVPFTLDDSRDTNVHLYVFQADRAPPFINMKLLYSSSKWLFINSFSIIADDDRYDFNKVQFERDHDSKIWEWYIKVLEEKDIEMIKRIISSKKSTIRFYGQQYYYDHIITAQEKEAMQVVLDAFSAIKRQAKI